MRLAAMPAAELQETGRIPPNAHHSMLEDGCRPCSGLDPPIGMSPWNVSSSRLPLAFVFLFFAEPSPRGKGAKGKSRGEGRPAARRGSLGSPKVKAVLSGFRAIFHAGNSHFRANRGGAARCEQPGVRGAARGGARAHRQRFVDPLVSYRTLAIFALGTFWLLRTCSSSVGL